jgi:hypothetical protein
MKTVKVNRIRDFFSASVAYFAVSIFFFLGVLTSRGDVAQQDWGVPITVTAALRDAHSLLYVWSYNGFGGVTRVWGYPSFSFLNAFLAPFGFVGGAEIKLLAVFLIALSGITLYALGRSFGLGFFSSFLAGLFFMSTAVVFDWLMFGWIYYLIGYAFLPLMILATKKFLETNDIRFVLLNALIFVIGLQQPAFILVYPLICLLFVFFESKANPRAILKGLTFLIGSSVLYLLTSLGYFLTQNSNSMSFYYGDYFSIIQSQFQYLTSIVNPIRLWGSTFAFQFETYFPKEIALISFAPVILALIVVLLKPHNRKVLFCLICYMFVFISYEAYANLHFLVFNLPDGAIFEAPNIFLAPAALGLAMLIGFAHEIFQTFIRLRKVPYRNLIRIICFVLILIIVISATIPWWTGKTSGNPIFGVSTKLNLYQTPPSYTQWSNSLASDNTFFVLYVTSELGRAQIPSINYFSQMYEGVDGAVFTEINDLPYITNTTTFINELFTGSNNISEQWGLFSIKYIVIYTNIDPGYNSTDLISRLSNQNGMVEIVNLPDIIVFKNENAEPVVYSESSNAKVEITYHNPTSYKITANSTSPYLLTLNQLYSSGWTASVNGVTLSPSEHINDTNGFNGWYINQTGNMSISIYYQPQTTYLIAFLISSGVIVAMASCIVIITVLKRKQSMRQTTAKSGNSIL